MHLYAIISDMNILGKEKEQARNNENQDFEKPLTGKDKSSKLEKTASETAKTNIGKQGLAGQIWSLLTTLIIVLAIVIPIRIYLGQPFMVSGSSMDPSFESWDYLITDVFTYKFLHEPQRGDVVVFVAPVENHKFFIKRIIGLPGETVEIKDGRVIIYNNKYKEGFELKEPYIAPENRSYRNLKRKLENDEYFVMGDNRAGSYDSRMWGPLKRSAIVGRPILRLFPFNEINLFPAAYADYQKR